MVDTYLIIWSYDQVYQRSPTFEHRLVEGGRHIHVNKWLKLHNIIINTIIINIIITINTIVNIIIMIRPAPRPYRSATPCRRPPKQLPWQNALFKIFKCATCKALVREKHIWNTKTKQKEDFPPRLRFSIEPIQSILTGVEPSKYIILARNSGCILNKGWDPTFNYWLQYLITTLRLNTGLGGHPKYWLWKADKCKCRQITIRAINQT